MQCLNVMIVENLKQPTTGIQILTSNVREDSTSVLNSVYFEFGTHE